MAAPFPEIMDTALYLYALLQDDIVFAIADSLLFKSLVFMMLLEPGVDRIASLSNVDLTTFTGHFV
jgi:hypothetical protein